MIKFNRIRKDKFFKNLGVGIVASAIAMSFSVPAYADDVFANPVQLQIKIDPLQTLTSAKNDYVVESNVEIKPEKVATIARTQSVVTRNRDASESFIVPSAPSGSVTYAPFAASLVEAARGEIGAGQDCTDLVQNALASLGKTVRRDHGGYDEGPMTFAKYGTVIPTSEARYGDIVARPGHVFIYTGDGVHHSGIHGGWNGGDYGTTVAHAGEYSNPANYSMAIRVK